MNLNDVPARTVRQWAELGVWDDLTLASQQTFSSRAFGRDVALYSDDWAKQVVRERLREDLRWRRSCRQSRTPEV